MQTAKQHFTLEPLDDLVQASFSSQCELPPGGLLFVERGRKDQTLGA